MTEQERLRKIHLNEQTWRHLREWKPAMQLALGDRGYLEDDAALLKGLCSYVLIRMELEDAKEADALKADVELTTLKRRQDSLVCQKDSHCDLCENNTECFDLGGKINKLENE